MLSAKMLMQPPDIRYINEPRRPRNGRGRGRPVDTGGAGGAMPPNNSPNLSLEML